MIPFRNVFHLGKSAWLRCRKNLGKTLLAAVLLTLIATGCAVAAAQIRAWQHFRRAQTAVALGHNSDAKSHLDACLAVWPDDPESLLLAARTARRLGDFNRAQRFLDRYFSIRKKSDDDNLILENLLLAGERDDPDRLKRFCLALVGKDHPDSPLVLEATARGYLRVFRWKDAQECLDQWLKRQPDSPLAWFLLGKTREQTLQVPEAVTSYRKALDLDPAMDEARLRLAGHLLELARAKEALLHLEVVQERQADNPHAQVLLARCLDQLGRAAEAEVILDKVLERYPYVAAALAERGKLAVRGGQLTAAESFLEKATRLEPGNTQAHYQYYQCLLKGGKTAEADRIKAKMRKIDQDVQAIQDIVMRKLPAQPHDPALHVEAGLIAVRAGSIPEGVRWLKSALKIDPAYVPAHKALAEHYERVGSPGRARHHRRLAGQPDALSPQRQQGKKSTRSASKGHN